MRNNASNKMCALITSKIKKLHIDMQKLFFEIVYNIFVLVLHHNFLFCFVVFTSQDNSHLPSPINRIRKYDFIFFMFYPASKIKRSTYFFVFFEFL